MAPALTKANTILESIAKRFGSVILRYRDKHERLSMPFARFDLGPMLAQVWEVSFVQSMQSPRLQLWNEGVFDTFVPVEVHAAPRRQARDTARTARLRGTFRLYKKRRRCLHMEEHGHGKTWEAVDS